MRTIKVFGIGMVGLIAAASLSINRVSAQGGPGPITGYEIQVYRAADSLTGVPFRTLGTGVATCGLVPTVPPLTSINPLFVEFDDPAIPGRACRIPYGVFFAALPVATGYRATLTAMSGALMSARSNATGPFDVALAPPAAPTGVGVRP